jgi:predicted metalloprotease
MLWRRGRRSDNVEDRRGAGGFGGLGGGLGGGFGGPRRGVGIGGGLGLIVIVVLALLFGVDPTTLLQGLNGTGEPGYQTEDNRQPGQNSSNMTATDEKKEFVSHVLGDTEDTWNALFQQLGRSYEDPRLVLFSGTIQSACGFAQAAMGPFYCPADSKVYIDLSFYDELQRRFQAPGDFAQAYVIAHEVGHHVQHLLGITDQVDRQRSRLSKADANALSVRVELQADCFAGIWAYHADSERNLLEEGDVDEALNAAAAIGDDRLQEQSQGYVVPDSFTHGSSEQRVKWFKTGWKSGDPAVCDTSSNLE